jgi:hypothetical protein
MQSVRFTKKLMILCLFLHLGGVCFAQGIVDTSKQVINLKGSVGVTNNGFSFIPTFSLGKPAVLFNFNVNGGKRFSFEPQFYFSLEGKPWSFVFASRYKVVNGEKFQLVLGTHLPAFSFKTVSVVKNGVAQDLNQASLFFPVLEVMPNYNITKNTSVGLFYLYGHGAEVDLPKNTHFLSLRANFANIKLSGQYALTFSPQVFYLYTNGFDGYYAAANLSLSKKDCPFSLSAMCNKAVQTDIVSKDFDWNVGLTYALSRTYVR